MAYQQQSIAWCVQGIQRLARSYIRLLKILYEFKGQLRENEYRMLMEDIGYLDDLYEDD